MKVTSFNKVLVKGVEEKEGQHGKYLVVDLIDDGWSMNYMCSQTLYKEKFENLVGKEVYALFDYRKTYDKDKKVWYENFKLLNLQAE